MSDAMSEAVEVMARALLDTDELNHDVRSNMAVALRALLSPIVTDCEPCGGTGKVGRQYRFPPNPPGYQLDPCDICHGSGQVTRPSLAVQVLIERGELEQEGSLFIFEGKAVFSEAPEDFDLGVPLYRIASEETPSEHVH